MLGLDLGLVFGSQTSHGLGLEYLVKIGLSLEEKVLQFFKTFVIILDGSEQGTPWHVVRDNKSSLPFGSHWLREPSALHAHSLSLEVFNKVQGLFAPRYFRSSEWKFPLGTLTKVPGNFRSRERMFPGIFVLHIYDNTGERTVWVTTSYT